MQSIESLKEGVKVLLRAEQAEAVEFLGLSFELHPWESHRERRQFGAGSLGRNLHIHDFFARLFPRWLPPPTEKGRLLSLSQKFWFLFPDSNLGSIFKLSVPRV